MTEPETTNCSKCDQIITISKGDKDCKYCFGKMCYSCCQILRYGDLSKKTRFELEEEVGKLRQEIRDLQKEIKNLIWRTGIDKPREIK